MPDLTKQYLDEVTRRLDRLAALRAAIDAAVAAIADSLEAGGVVQAFGTGHSEAFAMEIAGRAGGLIATNRIALRTLVLRGDRERHGLVRGDRVARERRDPRERERVGVFDRRVVRRRRRRARGEGEQRESGEQVVAARHGGCG